MKGDKLSNYTKIVISIVFALGAFGPAFGIAQAATDKSNEVLTNIVNEGSTNEPGWDLTINYNGSGTLQYQNVGAIKVFQNNTFDAKDLRKSLSVTKLKPIYMCNRSASFGAQENITYMDKATQGIDCYIAAYPQSPLSIQLNDAFSKAGV